jgi:hypothetical protein
MEALIYFNTAVSILLIIYVLHVNNRFRLSWSRTTYNKKLLGVNIMWKNTSSKTSWSAKGLLYIPLRFNQRLEVREEALRLIASSPQKRIQSLQTKFTWIKTPEEMEQFKKDFIVVDEKLVKQLENEFYTNYKR